MGKVNNGYGYWFGARTSYRHRHCDLYADGTRCKDGFGTKTGSGYWDGVGDVSVHGDGYGAGYGDEDANG